MERFALISLILLLTLVLSAYAQNQVALEERLVYLTDIPEISWVEFDGNNVYIRFNKRPSDLESNERGAAAFGNRAYGFGVNVRAVTASEKGWRPGKGSSPYCSATGRYGKVESNCR
jgi:hypothetical protein